MRRAENFLIESPCCAINRDTIFERAIRARLDMITQVEVDELLSCRTRRGCFAGGWPQIGILDIWLITRVRRSQKSGVWASETHLKAHYILWSKLWSI